MQHRQLVCGFLVSCHDRLLDTAEVLPHIAPVPQEHVAQGQGLEHAVLLHLVVKHLVLTVINSIVVLVALASDAAVPDCDGGCPRERGKRHVHKVPANLHHRDVLELRELGWGLDVLTFTSHLLRPGKHVEARDADICETSITDVCDAPIDLGADLPNLNTWHATALVVAELHHEAMEAVVLPIDDEVGHDGTVGAAVHACGPPLQGREVW
mmetsp:Transcript_102426/g.289659  ORF Transcript_102426/g.289659 Transcript_102426/m.289659 type:complete len:211 (-) Transcript_102426:529-1161(-)